MHIRVLKFVCNHCVSKLIWFDFFCLLFFRVFYSYLGYALLPSFEQTWEKLKSFRRQIFEISKFVQTRMIRDHWKNTLYYITANIWWDFLFDWLGPRSNCQSLGLGQSLSLNPHEDTHQHHQPTHHRNFLKDSRHIWRLRFDMYDPQRLRIRELGVNSKPPHLLKYKVKKQTKTRVK